MATENLFFMSYNCPHKASIYNVSIGLFPHLRTYGASIHICIDKVTFSGLCSQYRMGALTFPAPFPGPQFRLSQPGSCHLFIVFS